MAKRFTYPEFIKHYFPNDKVDSRQGLPPYAYDGPFSLTIKEQLMDKKKLQVIMEAFAYRDIALLEASRICAEACNEATIRHIELSQDRLNKRARRPINYKPYDKTLYENMDSDEFKGIMDLEERKARDKAEKEYKQAEIRINEECAAKILALLD